MSNVQGQEQILDFGHRTLDFGLWTMTKALLFLHIPKAAGTTLHSIIERQFAPAQTFTISGADSPQGIKEFTGLPAERREQIRLLKGPMPYGLHEYLSVPATHITMLRDPA